MADTFDADVAGLAGDVPIALLPVRIEARFSEDARELRVRIFPDQIHVNAHEPALTAAEREAGTAYWRARLGGDESAWDGLCASTAEPARAAWIARALEPTNLGQPGTPRFPDVEERPGGWAAAAVATALPERWVVIGVNDGRELFRVWSQPVAAALDVSPVPVDDGLPILDDELALQPAARWLVDFDAAEAAGMAVRITGVALDGGVDRLYALGVDWTLAPDAAAAAIGDLLAAHVYTDGLTALEPGTPTNITIAARSGPPPTRDELAAALNPDARQGAEAAGGGGGRLWGALGLPPGATGLLQAVPGSAGREQDVASRLADALWESTLGLYLADFMNPNVSDVAASRVRDHVRRHLFPGGPYPALRIGPQPYGVLPVVAPGRFTPAGSFEGELAAQLQRLRVHWTAATARVPRLGRTTDLDADVTAVLQTTPLAATLRYRHVVGPLTVNATRGLERHAAAQEQLSGLVGAQLGWPHRPFIAGTIAQPADHPLRVPLVDPVPISPDATLSRNYLREIAQLARTSGTYEAIKAREDADTLLEALVAHAVGRELHRADLRVIDAHVGTLGSAARPPAISVSQNAEFVGVEASPRPTAGALVTTPFEAARVVIGQRSVRETVTDAIRGGARSSFGGLDATLESLEWLAERPAAELDRGLRGLLDAYAHRLDAWFTSLAARRLADVRAARPGGVHLGAYGWLDDLRPDAGAPTSTGYVHAPSLAQAATAAVLRSGRVAHRDAEHDALDLDLRSIRVRLALGVLDGVAAGQPLAALLGYRFERSIREASLLLARHILPFRRLAPLRPSGDETTPAAGGGPAEAIAARDVVDGVALLDRWRADRDGLLGALDPPPSAADRRSLTAELDRLADLYDAVSDLMVAEAVHQNVAGNNERAGAVLAALDRQGIPPRMDFARTPRTGKSFAHRVLLLAGDERVGAAWPRDPRAAAEPRLNAWIARVVGDPARIRFSATTTGSGTAQELTASLTDLGLSPISLVLAAHAAGSSAPSELEERLAAVFAGRIAAPAPETELVVGDAAPAGSGPEIVGLGALRALLRRIYDLVTGARPAAASDLAVPQQTAGTAHDDVQLAARATALTTAYNKALTRLEAVTTAARLRARLWDAAAFGVEGSIPPPALPGEDDRDALAAQAAEVAATMRAALAASAAVPAGGVPPARVAEQTARVRALLGEHFPVLPVFTVPDPAGLRASVVARNALLGDDRLAPSAWLARMSLVRPDTDRLGRVRSAAELLGGGVAPRDLAVLQLPPGDGERWLALPFADAESPDAELAIVAHTSGTVDFGAPLAGLFCDGWTETIPDREETTGIAFHHDAPGSRPPQALLLAVPPAAENAAWSVDAILDTVAEAHDLSRLRAVGPRQLDWLGTLLPALYLPDSFSKDVPTVDLRGLVHKHAAENAATATILGKG